MKASKAWNAHKSEIAKRTKDEGLSDFLQWSVIHATMFVGNAPYIHETELPYLRSHDWARWRGAIRESKNGNPPTFTIDGQLTSGNLIHQAYCLARWETATFKTIGQMNSILEFGGGYGAMARVAHRAGFAGSYTIVDFPEMHTLQQHYLHGSNIKPTYLSAPSGIHDLFIACWSLSEMESTTAVLETLKKVKAKHWLIAYGEGNGVEMKQVKLALAARKGKVWTNEPITHLQTNHFLFGASE